MRIELKEFSVPAAHRVPSPAHPPVLVATIGAVLGALGFLVVGLLCSLT
jgi:hypothetical protein